jgi:hypothetical protein
VEDNLNAFAGSRTIVGVCQVSRDALHRLRTLEILLLSGNEVINAAYRFAAIEQCRCNRTANKPSSARNQELRQLNLLLKPGHNHAE